jgi:hypothetical protein
MKLRCHRLALLTLLSSAALVLGCKPPPSKAKFNNGIAEANLKLGQKALLYRKLLLPTGGKDVDPDKVDRTSLTAAWNDMNQALREVKEKYQDPDFVLPRKSTSSETLKSAYDDYLGAQSKILEMAKEINETLGDPKLGKAERKRKVEDLLEEIRKTEDTVFAKLQDAQKGVSDAHHFRIVTKLDP